MTENAVYQLEIAEMLDISNAIDNQSLAAICKVHFKIQINSPLIELFFAISNLASKEVKALAINH